MAAIETTLVGPAQSTFVFGAKQAHAVTLSGPRAVTTTYYYNLAGTLTRTTSASTYATAVAAGAITIGVKTTS